MQTINQCVSVKSPQIGNNIQEGTVGDVTEVAFKFKRKNLIWNLQNGEPLGMGPFPGEPGALLSAAVNRCCPRLKGKVWGSPGVGAGGERPMSSP